MSAEISVARHYDLLIDENNDPVHDPEPLKTYMERWDGAEFLRLLNLSGTESVLEIGVGTGRLALKTAPLSKGFCGIDCSPKTVKRAAQNLAHLDNVELLCADFMIHPFACTFDVIYASLTLMHIEHKQACFEKIYSLLESDGRFVLSIDKNQDRTLDFGTRRLRLFPDNPSDVQAFAARTGFCLQQTCETAFAHLFLLCKQ